MVTGEKPFHDIKNALAVMNQVRLGEKPKIPDTSSVLLKVKNSDQFTQMIK